ncbi:MULTISPECIES: hypothetical protein [Sphingobacterium]|uniref:Uncharacterized protein n=1 Tax=Sphingobacterium tenebrionis TaxID=3111775 RepID=A0ABU8I4B7_9SPHI|nr:hypothetical protein [Sphingobacterium sp. CZ-2]
MNIQAYHLGQLKKVKSRYIVREDNQIIVVNEFVDGGSTMEWIDEDVLSSIKEF